MFQPLKWVLLSGHRDQLVFRWSLTISVNLTGCSNMLCLLTPYWKVHYYTVFHFRVALLEDVQQIAAETDCQAGYIAKGISMACFYYGRCLHEGHGIQKDPAEAKKLYSKVTILIVSIDPICYTKHYKGSVLLTIHAQWKIENYIFWLGFNLWYIQS